MDQEHLDTIFHSIEDPGVRSKSSDGTLEALVSLIRGTKQSRFSPRIGDAEANQLRDRISATIDLGEPLEFITMWGAIKHYVKSDDQGIDLAELFAVLRLRELADSISEVYAPGVRIYILIEDFGVWYEDAYSQDATTLHQIARDSETYISELKDLVRLVGRGSIRTMTFFEAGDWDYRECIASVERNFEALQNYWNSPTERTSNHAYTQLQQLGWTGHISPRTRQHYLHRLATLYPNEPLSARTQRVLRYLATVLLYNQLDLQGMVSRTGIRLAFYKPAPGMGRIRSSNRIHLRGLPRRLCSTVMPPWTCKGCLVNRDGVTIPRIESFRHLSTSGARVRPGILKLLGTDSDPVPVRMDSVLLDDNEDGFRSAARISLIR